MKYFYVTINRQKIHNFLKFQSILLRCSNNKHTNAAVIEQIREKITSGPNFQDFVQNPDYTNDDWKEYQGKLKREKNDNERLRLPPWLKTKIPMGKKVLEECP